MSFNFKPQPLRVRTETVTTKRSAPSRHALAPGTQHLNSQQIRRSPAHVKEGVRAPESSKHTKPLSRRTPPVDFGDEESDTEVSPTIPKKKRKQDEAYEPDLERQVRSRKAFSDEDGGIFPMIHAASIPPLDKNTKYIPLIAGSSEEAEVSLQYPSASQQEKFRLLKPKTGDDNYEAIEDIKQVMHKVIEYYLPASEKKVFDNEKCGYPQRLSRAIQHQAEAEVRAVIEEWNTAIIKFRDEGIIPAVLDEYKSLDSKLVERILSQACSRTVSLRIKDLARYEAGSDNVYGELMPRFVSDILKKDTRMKSNQVFVDLGSGVGNVVLQAALETGCESWGCEMMSNYCDLAESQKAEFEARCRLWGLSAGEIHLERGDFTTNEAIFKVLPRADVIVVNNQVFTPELNEKLTNLFLDLKEGCRIVSLKSFVPAGHKMTSRNLYSFANRLRVEQKEYYSGYVSWTNAPGTYYVSTKDSRKVNAFAKRSEGQVD